MYISFYIHKQSFDSRYINAGYQARKESSEMLMSLLVTLNSQDLFDPLSMTFKKENTKIVMDLDIQSSRILSVPHSLF